jgi:glycosyltransferase involved in cell wall biosynthesis
MIPTAADVSMTPAAARQRDAASPEAADARLALTLFVSCYNERPYVTNTLDTVQAALAEVGNLSCEIIVIDDCSSDGSADVVADYMRRHADDEIILRRNKVNRGLAQNYLDAAFMGHGKYFRQICGDNSEPADTMVAVFRAIGRADMILPYYAVQEGRSAYRLRLSTIYTWLVNRASGLRLHYYNGLAVHLRYNVMRWHTNTKGFGFQAGIICALADEGFSYLEVPVRSIERKGEDSMAVTWLNFLSVAHTLADITIRRLSNRLYRRVPACRDR